MLIWRIDRIRGELAVELLTRLKGCEEGERQKFLKEGFNRILDGGKLAAVIAKYRGAGRRLRAACHMEFGLLFLAFPVLGELLGIRLILLPFLLCLLAFGLFISWEYQRVYRVLHGSGDPNRGSVTAMLLLSPVAATRAFDQLAAYAVSRFHPLAVASVLFSRETFLAEASRYLRAVKYPLPEAGSAGFSGPTGAQDWLSENWRDAVERFLGESFDDPVQLLSPPRKDSEKCRSYCPRSCSQYRFEAGDCVDCNLPVHRFVSSFLPQAPR